MPIDYTAIREQASIAILDAGQSMTLVRTTSSGKPWDPIKTPEETTATGVLTGFTVAERELVQQGDKKVLMSAVGLAFEPAPGHALLIGGARHTVVAVDPLRPGGTPLLYRVQVRQ